MTKAKSERTKQTAIKKTSTNIGELLLDKKNNISRSA